MKKSKFLQSVVLCSLLLGANTLYAKTKVDIIFAMDTSGSMSDEASALKSAISTVGNDLSSIYDLETKSWGIEYTSTSWGLSSNVKSEIGNSTTINHPEDWGPATYDLATYYSGWRADTIKIVVPISDEGPENGGGYNTDRDLDAGDEIIIDKARTALDSTSIYSIPVISDGRYQDKIYREYALILSDDAIKMTNGTSLIEQFKTIISDIVAEASGTSLGSINAGFRENFNGGKLVINAKGASKYKVVAKFDGTEFLSTTSTSSVISIAFPEGYDKTVSHVLDITYTAYAVDTDGQVLEEKSKMLQEVTSIGTQLVSYYPELKTVKVKSEPIFLAGNSVDAQAHSSSEIMDPVDVSSGNFYFSHSDLTIPTAGIPLIIKRLYNSLEPIRGWKFNIDNIMDISDTNNIKVSWQGGDSKDLFIKAKDGWVSLYSTDTLTTESGAYVVTKSSGTKYKFSTSGELIGITNKQDLGLVFEHSGSTTIVQDNFGTLLATISRNGSGQITGIMDSAGNSISYTYDGVNLTSYTNRNGDTESYEYSADLIDRILGVDGVAYVTNTYDAQGRATSQLDARGNETAFVYSGDLANMVVDSVDVTYPDGIIRTHEFNMLLPTKIEGSGTTVDFDYDANNKVKSITDTNGKKWSYERNSAGLITKSIDPQGQSTLYLYDTANNLIQLTSIDGKVTKFEYDTNTNLTKITYADGTTSSFEYDTNSLLTKTINQLGHTTQYAYNARGFIERVTMPNGATVSYTYTPLGEVSTVTDPLGNVTKYEYDKEGRLAKTTNALNHSVTYGYNGYGDLIKITDPKNRTLQMEYNTDGLLTKTILPDGNTIEATYDVVGRLIESKDILGRVAKKEYDSFGRVSKVTDPKGNEFSFEYDLVGNLTKVIDANGNDAGTEYDELYRPSNSIDAKGITTSTTSYNDLSLPTKVEDAVGKSLDFSYDTLNRLQSSTLSGLLTASATYNAIGQMTKVIDPKGYETLYEYDLLGNITKETTPLAKDTTYTYDIAGRTTTSTDANGVVTSFAYDAIGNLTSMIIGAKVTSYTYDAVGNILTVEDASGKIIYTHDINDRVTSRTDIYGNVVGYAYDTVGRLSKLTYSDAKTVEYFYDDNDNLVKVKDFAARETIFEYDANSNLTKATYPNGAYTEYISDKNDRILSLKNYDKTGKLLTADELTRNDIGDITDIQKTELANLNLSKVKNFNFEVNEFNQITKSAEGDFTYDNNGNLLSYIYDGKTINLTYDETESLTQAKIASDTFDYSYDAEGNRVEVNKNGTTTRYLIDNVLGLSKPLAKMDTGNNIQTYYIWTNGLGYEVSSDGKIAQYLYDYKGNTNAIIDDANSVKASYAYTSYGKLIGQTGERDNLFTSLGKYGIMSDSESLYYVRARYYSPELDRWTQADVKRGGVGSPASLNRYIYNEGDGVNFVDVSGYTKAYDFLTNIMPSPEATQKYANAYFELLPGGIMTGTNGTGQWETKTTTGKWVQGSYNEAIRKPSEKIVENYKKDGKLLGTSKMLIELPQAAIGGIVNAFKGGTDVMIDDFIEDPKNAETYKGSKNLIVDTLDLAHGLSKSVSDGATELSKDLDNLQKAWSTKMYLMKLSPTNKSQKRKE